MTAISGFSVVDENGFPVLADPHGNNVAFRCVGCGGPVLAVLREHQRGSSVENPAVCRACSSQFWVEPADGKPRLVLHRMLGRTSPRK